MKICTLLSIVSEDTIMQQYFPEAVIMGKKYTNPFRSDRNPSCFFSRSSGKLRFVDMSRPEYGGDCFDIVRLSKNLKSFGEVMSTIKRDFNIDSRDVIEASVSTPVFIEEPKRREMVTANTGYQYKITIRNFNKNDEEYWSQFGISVALLKKYRISPVKLYYSKKKMDTYFEKKYEYLDKNDPCYCYLFPSNNKVKLYRPLVKNKKFKWNSNTSSDNVQGYDQLKPKDNDLLIITSSMKDLLVFVSHGIPAIAPQSESTYIPDDILEILKAKYKTIIIVYDNDAPGIKLSKRHSLKYKLPYALIPEEFKGKDIAEIYKNLSDKTQMTTLIDAIVKQQNQIITDVLELN